MELEWLLMAMAMTISSARRLAPMSPGRQAAEEGKQVKTTILLIHLE